MEKLPKGWIKLTLYDDYSSNLRSIFFKIDSLSYVYRRKDISGEHTHIHTISQSGYKVCETPEWILNEISKAEADYDSN